MFNRYKGNITIEKDDINTISVQYFHQFNVVILIEAQTETLIRVNDACRIYGAIFFCGDAWGIHGYGFYDLQKYEFEE